MTRNERARLYAARELLVVGLLDHVLAALDVALLLEHPTLDEPPFTAAPPTLRRARALARAARRLRRKVDRYREAVDHALVDHEADELPF
jgi:hypothetical protein